MYQYLLETLRKLNDVHQQLLAIAEKKKQAIIDHRVQDVSALAQHEAQLVQQAGKLEEERRFQVQEVMKPKAKGPSIHRDRALNRGDGATGKTNSETASEAGANDEHHAGDHAWTMEEVLQEVRVPAMRERLSQSMSALQQTMLHLREVNQLNMLLTEDALHYVEHSLDLVTQARSANINYDRPTSSGQEGAAEGRHKQGPTGQSFFDTKA